MRDDADDEVETALGARYQRRPAAPATFSLEVIDGPDRGVCFTIDGSEPGPVLLGKSPSCAFRLTDPQVSRRHAALDVEGSRLRITDVGSTNGIWVGDLAILDAYVSGGEVVRIGATTLRTRLDASSPAQHRRAQPNGFGRLLGASAEMQRLYPLLERLAQTDVSILIEGETGTGKEVLAESIHEASPRRNGPYVVLDCTTIPATLVESELFGHERGAFTGATAARAGVFEQAHGGTLLIDEIGDLEPALQPKFLRALERGEIRRVGGARAIRVDVRVLAATRRDLDRAVQEGAFRDDLFHRLAIARIELPPLRRRQGDIAFLAARFWKELGGQGVLPASLCRRWEADRWPGNVRALRNAVARQIAIGDVLLPGDLAPEPAPSPSAGPDPFAAVLDQRLPFPIARVRILDAFQKAYVERAIEEHGGDANRAAQASGISHRYLNMLRFGRSGR